MAADPVPAPAFNLTTEKTPTEFIVRCSTRLAEVLEGHEEMLGVTPD